MKFSVIGCLLFVCLWFTPAVWAMPSIEVKTTGLTKLDGYFPLYWDEAEGKVWLEIPRLNEDFLYIDALPTGLGSNDIGLDRGQLGETRIVHFERVGPKVLLIAPNLQFRASSTNPAERQATKEAFAESVVYGFTVTAESPGRLLVDASDFVIRDAHGVIDRLKQTKQGSFRLDLSRSSLYREGIKAFPDNTELEARLTYAGEEPGAFVQSVAADPKAISLRVHHSFVKLPPSGFEPRAYDPRSGYFDLSYFDYATPIGEPLVHRLITRHRLLKKDPTAAVSEPVKPIIYYLDPGTPEPVRSALIEGASWWSDAFVAAGFKNAFRVEILPANADPMDVRYNIIQWVHRSTRGWSYGSSVADPRTGEIIQGRVTLGSLRVRQDYLLAEGLLAPYSGNDIKPEMLQLALARMRQLAAHEVGHTLGLAHNFAASNTDRASVMDYPAPYASVNANGLVDVSKAYAKGIGEWDKVAIRFGYSQFAEGTDEQKATAAILSEAQSRGLRYLTDQDARPLNSAQPQANLWDNGQDALTGLRNQMAVRKVALDRFGEANIRVGQPLATLEEVLVPLYLGHRYQAVAASKMLGGSTYAYTLRGDGQPEPKPVSAAQQIAALDLLLQTLTPSALSLPESVRTALPPRPPGYDPTRELFGGHTGVIFDVYAPAETAAGMIFDLILDPERATRLAYQKDFTASLPDLHTVLTRIDQSVWRTAVARESYDASLQRIVQQAWVDALMDTASAPASVVRANVHQHLQDLVIWLSRNPGNDFATRAHRNLIKSDIQRFLARPYTMTKPGNMLPIPPGEPIGDTERQLRQAERQKLLNRLDADFWDEPEFSLD